MRIQVLVRLKPAVLDVQGKAVEHGLKDLGFSQASNVRIGKLIEFDCDGSDFESAKARVDDICKKLLANTLIETYEIRRGG